MFEVEAELALLKINFFHTFVTQIKKMANRINFILLIFLILSCDSKPKVIVADANSRETGAPSNTEVAKVESEPMADDLHQVVAQEILNTDKYTYVNVTEKSDKFWIAVSKQKIEKGHTYYFRGGLRKENFYSKEFDRTFDVVYLVSSIIDSEAHPGGQIASPTTTTAPMSESKPTNTSEAKSTGKEIAIKEILANGSAYKGKKIQVSGECVKANYQIMNRNWYHIQDGQKNDLTVTSADQIKVGDKASFEGVLAIDKDFGAGYRYKVILEEARVSK
jgi:hypothetical protein